MAFSPFALAARLMLAVASSNAQAVTVESCDFGEVYAFQDVECQFDFHNAGEKPVRMTEAIPARPADEANGKTFVVPPHAHAYLRVSLKTENGAGVNQHPFRFRMDDGNEYGAVARGFVMTVLDQTHPEIDFGVVDVERGPVEKSIALTSAEASDFRVTKLLEAPSWLDARIEEGGHSVKATTRPDADWGSSSGFIKLQTNNHEQKQVWVAVKADIHGAVVPAFNPLDLGLLRVGDNNSFRLPLKAKNGRPFEVSSVTFDGAAGEVKSVPCQPAEATCRWLELMISDAQAKGFVKGTIRVALKHEKPVLNIAVRGFLVDKDFVAKKVDEETLRKGEQGEPSSRGGASHVPLQNAIAAAVKQSNEKLPPGDGPLLRWHVANGQSIHGFQIFRGDSEQGPFALLNRPTLPSSAEDNESTGYSYRDNTAKSGKTYWYYIGIVFSDGRKQQLTSPQRVVAK